METHHIILQHDPSKEWASAADVLAQALNMNRGDAVKICRRGYGLVLNPLEKEAAEFAAAALTQSGISAKCFPASQLVEAPPALSVVSVTIENDTLRFVTAAGNAQSEIPLAAVRALYAGNLIPAKQKNEHAALAEMNFKTASRAATEQTTSGVATGLAVGAMLLGGLGPLGMLGAQHIADQTDPRNIPPPTAKPPQKPEPTVDILCATPLLRLRFTQRKFNYQTLGRRLLPNMRGNFRLVINDLLTALPHAALLGQFKEAAGGAILEQDRFIREDADLSLEISAILTRDVHFSP